MGGSNLVAGRCAARKVIPTVTGLRILDPSASCLFGVEPAKPCAVSSVK